MSKKPDYTEHHQPRPLNKKKKHKSGFNEDVADNRRSRINFKNYVRQLKEEELDNYDEDDYNDE